MEILYNSWLIFFLILPSGMGQVFIKVTLQPPLATLECSVRQSNEKTSVILMCPNEKMCFQNCTSLCNTEDCKTNDISCSKLETKDFKKFTYVFNACNAHNQGEWTCYYGSEKHSSVVFIEKGNQDKCGISDSKSPLMNPSRSKLTPIELKPNSSDNVKRVDPKFVLVLLMLFSISLIMNIVFIIRDILMSLSKKKSIRQFDNSNDSWCLNILFKLFCVEKLFIIKKTVKRNPPTLYNKPLILNKNSKNFFQPPSVFPHQQSRTLENCAITEALHSENSQFSNNSFRSQSYSLKTNTQTVMDTLPANTSDKPRINESISSTEITNQAIYDDVAEPSLLHSVFERSIYYSSLARQNNRINRNLSIQNRQILGSMSMSNLNHNSQYASDSMVGTSELQRELLLKDEINSRVELSKEMINQADTLLRKADNLLKKKDVSNK